MNILLVLFLPFDDFDCRFQKIRPSLDDIPKEIVPLLESCWAEDPKSRPEFKDIINTLLELYQNLFPTEFIKAPKAFEFEHPNSNTSKDPSDSPNIPTQPLKKPEKKFVKRGRSSLFSFLRCFKLF